MAIVSLIGAGHIGQAVVNAIASGLIPGVELGAVLVRDPSGRVTPGVNYTANWDALVASAPELVIDLAGPKAFKTYGVRALSLAETWSISATALADRDFDAALSAAIAVGGRLRLLSGAIGGLDAVAAASIDPDTSISVTAALVDTPPDAHPDFIGSAREVVQRFDGLNVVAAVALAGRGLDDTPVRFFHRNHGEQRRFTIVVTSQHGSYLLQSCPTPKPGPSAVVASVLAALKARSSGVSVG